MKRGEVHIRKKPRESVLSRGRQRCEIAGASASFRSHHHLIAGVISGPQSIACLHRRSLMIRALLHELECLDVGPADELGGLLDSMFEVAHGFSPRPARRPDAGR